MPLTLALGTQRQVYILKFEASLIHIVSSKIAPPHPKEYKLFCAGTRLVGLSCFVLLEEVDQASNPCS